MKKVFLRSEFNYDTDEVSASLGLTCPDEGLTVQSQKEDADINVIMNRVMKQGAQLPIKLGPGRFGNFTEVPTFRQAHEELAKLSGFFSMLNADTRAMFRNDPVVFAEFISDEANAPQLVELGLLDPPASKPDAAAEPAQEPPQAPTPPPKAA